jgi:ribosomal protein S27AE
LTPVINSAAVFLPYISNFVISKPTAISPAKKQPMDKIELVVEEPLHVATIKTKSTERDCPRCDNVLSLNDNEQCYECLNCGYIDCGDEG